MAVEHEADMLLLGGDLFHDNKPSHTTVRTMQPCVSRLARSPLTVLLSSLLPLGRV